jgi:hypothetical protein
MSPQTPKAELQYESPPDLREVMVELSPDGSVTITVPTRRTAWRYISAMCAGKIGAIVIAPIAWLIFVLFATKRPRAVLRITPEEFIVVEHRDDTLGRIATTRSWPRKDVGELRRNRFDKGLWMTLPGRDSFGLLEDVDGPMLDAVAAAIAEARKRLAAVPVAGAPRD